MGVLDLQEMILLELAKRRGFLDNKRLHTKIWTAIGDDDWLFLTMPKIKNCLRVEKVVLEF